MRCAAGKRLIPVHFDRPISTTRLLIESTSNPPPRFLLIHDNERDRWELPGGEASEEEERVGWDVGARIGALQSIIQKELSADIPWMSYIDDVEAEHGVCRVYGYIDADQVLESSTEEDSSRRWFTSDRLRDTLGDNDPICRILRSWQRDDILRGKGKAIRQSKNQFD